MCLFRTTRHRDKFSSVDTSSVAGTSNIWVSRLQGSIPFSPNEFCQFCVFVKGLVCGWQVKPGTDWSLFGGGSKGLKWGEERAENVPDFKFLGEVNIAWGWGLWFWFCCLLGFFFPLIEGKMWVFCYKLLFRKLWYLIFKRCFIVPRSVSIPHIDKH